MEDEGPLLAFRNKKQEKYFVLFGTQATLFTYVACVYYQNIYENKILLIVIMILLLYLSLNSLREYLKIRKGESKCMSTKQT